MKNVFQGKKVKKVQATLIKEAGDFIMNLTRFEFINSFEKNFDHDLKADITTKQEAGELWADPTPQIAITFGCTVIDLFAFIPLGNPLVNELKRSS